MTPIKKIFIIHGWASSPEDCWFPWLIKKLQEMGYEVIAPAMPNPRHPEIFEWVSTLKEITKNIDLSHSFFIGHSLGCYIILRFLEELQKEEKVGGILCVGGSMGLRDRPRVDAKKVLLHTKHIFALFSDNDYYIPLSERESFETELFAKTFVLPNRGHFSRKENITEIPEILKLLEQLTT